MQEMEYENLCDLYGKDRVDAELAIEEESKELAYNNFKRTLQKSIGNHEGGTVGTSASVLKNAIPMMSLGLQKFYDEADTGKPGRRHIVVGLIRDAGVELVSYLTLKVVFGHMLYFPMGIPLSSLSTIIGRTIEDELRYKRIVESMDDRDREITLRGVKKRVGTSFKRAYLNARERAVEAKTYDKWTKKERAQLGLKLVEIMYSSTGLIEYTLIRGRDETFPTYRITFKREVVDKIIANDERIADSLFTYRPMVIPPKEWTTPFDGGYYLEFEGRPSLVRIPPNRVHKLYDDVYMPNVYKAVNAIQGTAWRVNKKVLEVASEMLTWEHMPEGLDMPSLIRPEPPVRPPEADTDEEVHEEWRRRAAKFYQEEVAKTSKRLRIKAILDCCKDFKDYPEIYFPHNLDFRGRVYSMTLLSPQGDDFTKGLIEFAKGVEVGEDGATWLAFHGANTYGLDKATIEERLTWVYSNSDFITRIAEAPLENLEWTDADSPWEFLAFCFEWNEYLKTGETYSSHLPIAFDGSCSGLQHFSALLKDEVGGRAVNLIPMDEVQDIYKIVADKVVEMVKLDLENGTQDEIKDDILYKGTKSLAKEWMDYGITRNVTKRCVMTLPYGATQFGFIDQVLDDTVYPALSKNVLAFSKPRQAARYMAEKIWVAVHKVVVKAMEAMEWLREASSLLAKDKDVNGNPLPTFWTTPAGFPVRQEYSKYKSTRINTFLNNSIRIKEYTIEKEKTLEKGESLKISYQTPDSNKLDSRKQRSGIAPNFIHSLDASHLMLTVCACYDMGVESFAMIHDSYGTHAGNASIMFNTVRDVFVDTYTKNDILGDFEGHVRNLLSTSQLEKLPSLPKAGNLDLEGVKKSLYAFA